MIYKHGQCRCYYRGYVLTNYGAATNYRWLRDRDTTFWFNQSWGSLAESVASIDSLLKAQGYAK